MGQGWCRDKRTVCSGCCTDGSTTPPRIDHTASLSKCHLHQDANPVPEEDAPAAVLQTANRSQGTSSVSAPANPEVPEEDAPVIMASEVFCSLEEDQQEVDTLSDTSSLVEDEGEIACAQPVKGRKTWRKIWENGSRNTLNCTTRPSSAQVLRCYNDNLEQPQGHCFTVAHCRVTVPKNRGGVADIRGHSWPTCLWYVVVHLSLSQVPVGPSN